MRELLSPSLRGLVLQFAMEGWMSSLFSLGRKKGSVLLPVCRCCQVLLLPVCSPLEVTDKKGTVFSAAAALGDALRPGEGGGVVFLWKKNRH